MIRRQDPPLPAGETYASARRQEDDVKEIKKEINEAVEGILQRHASVYDFGVRLDKGIEHDRVFAEIEEITDGKVGPPFVEPEEVAQMGHRRCEAKVPPGYADHDKEPAKAIGDFLLWEHTLIEAEQRQLPVLLVSNDGKEDWVRKEGGFARGPRPELVDEMLVRTGQRFHLVNLKAFLTHAKAYLKAQVSDATLEQAESVQHQPKEGIVRSAEEENLLHILSRAAERNRSLDNRAIWRAMNELRALHATDARSTMRRFAEEHGPPEPHAYLTTLLRAVQAVEAGGEVHLVSSEGVDAGKANSHEESGDDDGSDTS
ncbi:PIN-like domain-containing protein [Nonomuraea sp. NPDC050540]|uniref:PIN-like domain-containing protein n=1 Tax=Nonomuraea sp. NPDC050540 TaxID=3364367 RepID=UPI0037A9913D